jgi:hypothetical protein
MELRSRPQRDLQLEAKVNNRFPNLSKRLKYFPVDEQVGPVEYDRMQDEDFLAATEDIFGDDVWLVREVGSVRE